MAFNPTSNPVIWLYEWYAGFTAALQTEVNKEYGYETYDDMKQDWGSFDIDIDGAQIMNSAISAFVGSPLANKIVPVKPVTIQTDDGPRAVIATGQMITAATGEAVRLKIDGFLTSIPWDTVVAEVMMANNYEILPDQIYNLSSKIATQIVGHMVTDTSGMYVTGKIALDQNGVARSYVDDYVVQGVINGAAAAGDILQNLVGMNVAEDVPIEAPELPQDRFGDLASRAMGMAMGSRNQQQQGEGYSSLGLLVGTLSSLVHAAIGYDDGFIMCQSRVYTYNSRPCLYLGAIKQTALNVADMFKYTSAQPLIGNFRTVAWSTDEGETWKDNPAVSGNFISARYVGYIDGQGHAQYESVSALPSELWSGTGVDYIEIGGINYGIGISSNFLATVVTGAEVGVHDIDVWMPTEDGERAIDELWPGWLAGALIGAGAIDVDSDVWFPTKTIPLGIDQTDVADPAQTISKPLDVAQAGAIAGAEAGAISLTDTIADAITIPSIYNPAIAIPATTSPTPTPTPVIPVLPPSISAQRLYTVHKVSQQELDTLGGYLWSSDFISLIEHMFTEPIDAVIGLHTLFYGGSLPTGQSGHQIKLGAIDATGCTGTLITNQFMKFQCGSVNIPEYWNNANDYAPYTEAEIFLPFIGFRDLDINEIMGGSVSLSYGIDIFTGACVAMIGVMRDHISQALYTFEGNCAIQQPVTGADYSRIIGGLISAGMGIATGGAGAVIGTAAALSSHKISYGRSGNISANAGACMPKQPYILIKRPNAYDAPNYRSFYGDPANWTVTLGSCSGYTRVKDVHLDQIACTDVEKEEILTMLKQGVII